MLSTAIAYLKIVAQVSFLILLCKLSVSRFVYSTCFRSNYTIAKVSVKQSEQYPKTDHMDKEFNN